VAAPAWHFNNLDHDERTVRAAPAWHFNNLDHDERTVRGRRRETNEPSRFSPGYTVIQ